MTGRQGKPSSMAAGLRAVAVTWQHARAKTGMLRALRVLSHANQKTGFDCPGCAWPEGTERAVAEFCENGAKAILDEATTRRAGPAFFEENSLADLRSWSERKLNDAGRLTTPMIARPGATHYQPSSYEECYELLAEKLCGLKDANAAAFYTSGRASNEAAYVFQLMARAFGTNNLPDCSNLCHESSGAALKETIGIGKGTVRLSDFSQSDLIFVIGQNPGTNHPRMLSALREAVKSGATVVSVNPLVETGLVKFAHPQELGDLLSGGVALASRFVRVRINGDLALFRGLNKRLIEMEAEHPGSIDREFIGEYTEGFEQLKRATSESDWGQIEEDSGLERREIEELVQLVLQSRKVICCWAMGLTQHENAVPTIAEVSNFLLLRGNIGKRGAGACPVRGHSNVQGDRTVGIAPALPPAVALAVSGRYHFDVPQERGLDSVQTILQMEEGAVVGFVALGGNFLSACPDTELTKRALSSCDFSLSIATKLNRSHLWGGRTSMLLPCLARSELDYIENQEQFVSVENSMGVVHASRGTLPPAAADLRGEPRIVAELAQALVSRRQRATKDGDPRKMEALAFAQWARDYNLIRDEIEEVIPSFSDYNKRVRQPGGFELENGPRERRFSTPSGRARFVGSTLRRVEAQPGELIMMTVRSHDQFNTTVYSEDDRYRGISGSREVLFVHPADLQERGLVAGARLRIISHFEGETRELLGFRAVPYDLPRGCAMAYFPEANPLVFANSFAETSGTPTSKSVRITVGALQARA